MQRKSDLYVITKVKELTEYIITVTEKSPKKFRFTLVARLQNYCLDVVENLYLANSLPLGEERLMHQQNAGRLLSMLGYFVMLASDCKCLLSSQAEYSSKLQAESLLFLGKWIASDKKRKPETAVKQVHQNVPQNGMLF